MIINYDGKWPNLCSGRLNVMLGGKLYKFGSNVIRSGGSCRCEFNTNENYVTKGEWHWSGGLKVPVGFPKERLPELLMLINDKVPHGCCGGCI